MNTRVVVGVVVVGTTIILLTPPVRQRLAGLLPKPNMNAEDLAPKLRGGASNALNVARDYRPQLVDAVTMILTNRDGTPNTTDPAARARAERLVDQGMTILETLVSPKDDDQRTIDGQVVQPDSTPAS
jgi:hypothetical protein